VNGLLPDGRKRGRGHSLAVVSFCLLVFLPGTSTPALGQEELTLPELEGVYRRALAGYEEAFAALEVLSSQFDRASQEVLRAQAAGDQAGMNRAYEETLRIAPRRRQAQRRVEEKVEELRVAREELLDARASYLEELLLRTQSAADPAEQRSVAIMVADTRNGIQELRSLEDPPVNLEPLPDINVEPRDGPADLRAKATILEVTAAQYEEQYAFNELHLEGLRRDQRLLRRSGDFLAGITRFDDPTVPVGPPGSRSVPQPGQVATARGADSLNVQGNNLTLEQRIEALETLQEEITQRIENIKVRAQTLRRLAGGEWA